MRFSNLILPYRNHRYIAVAFMSARLRIDCDVFAVADVVAIARSLMITCILAPDIQSFSIYYARISGLQHSNGDGTGTLLATAHSRASLQRTPRLAELLSASRASRNFIIASVIAHQSPPLFIA